MSYVETDALRLRVGTGWTEVEVTSEVLVTYTRRGYAPCIRVIRTGVPHILFVSAISLAEPLEKIRVAQGGSLLGARLRIRKTRAEPTAPYEVETVGLP